MVDSRMNTDPQPNQGSLESLLQLWIWDLAATTDELRRCDAVLSPDERARAARFVFPQDRISYMVARAGMRHLLARHCGRKPADLVFAYEAAGKPSIAGGPAFNLTHSGNKAALVIGRDAGVGIDIEQVRPISLNLAERFFSTAENAALAAVEDNQTAAFFRLWTRKEAVLKALGCGLSMDTRTFSVEIDSRPANGTAYALSGIEVEPGDDLAWSILDVDAGPGFAGAIATRQTVTDLQLFISPLERLADNI